MIREADVQGSDSRQYKYVLADERMQKVATMYAFDLPDHGRTEPTPDRMEKANELDVQDCAQLILAFYRAVRVERPVIIGSSDRP